MGGAPRFAGHDLPAYRQEFGVVIFAKKSSDFVQDRQPIKKYLNSGIFSFKF